MIKCVVSNDQMILQLPPDIYRIVYKYVYDSVLSQFKSWYGTTVLKQVPFSDCCERINDDITRSQQFYLANTSHTLFGFMFTEFNNVPANAISQTWVSTLCYERYIGSNFHHWNAS